MFLKRITICGFKSFPDKVDFEFGPGVTCIVGPNGCGKSNLVDAFKWVLGEQSARSLRGHQMGDMIFAGSATRRASSVAQVDLVFDNADRSLSLDFDEITVTRKLYRSGESEYQINQDVARLRDIKELFMDTGVGIDAYSVVEQGRVDGLLQSSPTERRLIFEEAAGVSKYKARRKEAERKLDRTQQNLLRVTDVIEELEKRLRSVKLQAGKARNYKEYEARLNGLRSSFAMAEYHRFSNDIDRLVAEVERQTDDVGGVKAEILRKESDESRITTELDRVAEQINEADSVFVQTKSELLAQEERMEAAAKRAEEQRTLLQRASERQETDCRRVEEASVELRRVQETAEALQAQTRALHDRVDELMERDRKFARTLTESQAVLQEEKAGIIELLRASAQRHNEVVRLNTHRESLVGQSGRLASRGTQIESELATAMELKARREQRVRELDALMAEQTQSLEDKQAETARVNEVRQRLVDDLAHAKEQRSAMVSRRELLEDLERRMEGVGTAARQLLERQKAAPTPTAVEGIVGLVADVFETDVAHAPVIEAALDAAAQHLIVERGDTFLQHPDEFANLPGRLTTICLDRLPPRVNQRDFAGCEGFVARAVDLVRFSDRYEQLATHLLGTTIVLQTFDHACAAAADDVSGHRFVTLQGEVVEPDGRICLGPASSSGGLISRKSELRDLDTRETELGQRISTLSDQLNRTQAETDNLEREQSELRSAMYDTNTEKVEANAANRNVQETVERLSAEQPLIAQEVALIEQQIDEVLAQTAESTRLLEGMERENVEREQRVEEQQEAIDQVVNERRHVQDDLTATKVQVGQLTEKRAAATETINTLGRTIHELQNALAEAKRDVEQCRGRIEDAETTVTQSRERAASLAKSIHDLEARCAEVRRTRDDLRVESEQLTTSIREGRLRLEKLEHELHEREMSLAEVNVRRDTLVTRVAEELDIDLSLRYAEYEHKDQNWEDVETEISELRRKMDRLGNVNLDAIDELEELAERHEFLTKQRDDLNDSNRQLQQLIEQLNVESRERFQTTFTQIRDHFRALFRKLFGGGRADIVLEDPEDILECGIEILAQPPGKELQSISLMSGGEKSMTAIALLMSIFSCRPAPFAIMDEVDAALDEANNDRFNRIVQEFVAMSQFLVITHSKWTMGIGDRLYGITMQEPGVSTRVSVELTGANVA